MRMQAHSAQATGLSRRLWRQLTMETKSYLSLVFTMAWGKDYLYLRMSDLLLNDMGTQHFPLISLIAKLTHRRSR